MSILSKAGGAVRFRTTHFFALTVVSIVLGFLGMVGNQAVHPLFDFDFGAPPAAAATDGPDADGEAAIEPDEPAELVFGPPQSELGKAIAERYGDSVTFLAGGGVDRPAGEVDPDSGRVQEPLKGDSVASAFDPDNPLTPGELTLMEMGDQRVWLLVETDDVMTGRFLQILSPEHEPIWPVPDPPANVGPPSSELGRTLVQELGPDTKFFRTRTPQTPLRMSDGTPLKFAPDVPGVEVQVSNPEPGDRIVSEYRDDLSTGNTLSLEIGGELVWLTVVSNDPASGLELKFKD